VAVYPPPATARALLDRLADLDLPPHRPLPAEQVHMTLQFLGDTPAGELESVCESVARSGAGLAPFPLDLETLVRLPERGPVRLVAARTSAHATLLELKTRLVTRLARRPRERPARRFLPHLTLCRFRAPARMPDLAAPIDDLPRFEVGAIHVMRSILRPEGARHEALARYELRG
jgi:2'-5' RNA ligase